MRERTEELWTPRRRGVLLLVAQGLTNEAISHRLGITTEEVRYALNALFRASGCKDRAHLVATAFREGLMTWNDEGEIGFRKDPYAKPARHHVPLRGRA